MSSRMEHAGLSVELPDGWEGQISTPLSLADGSQRRAVAHLATVPLPARRGDFGDGVVQWLRAGDCFVALFEHDPQAAGTPLFAAEGMPRRLTTADFHREQLQRPLPGQGGVQRFFTEAGRAFCLYVVVGSYLDRADVLGDVNRVLTSVRIDP